MQEAVPGAGGPTAQHDRAAGERGGGPQCPTQTDDKGVRGGVRLSRELLQGRDRGNVN